MVGQQLLDYVKKELARGVHEDKLRQVLLENNWPEFEINEAFDKARHEEPVKPVEKPVEKPQEGIVKEQVYIEEPKKEVIAGEKPEQVKKTSIIDIVLKIVMNKIFLIAFIILVLGSIVFFILPPLLEEGGNIGGDSSVVIEAKKACTQYCNNNLCGLFVNPEFSQPELGGKNCLDLKVQCKKCEVEY